VLRVLAFAADFYPLIFIPFVYTMLGQLIPACNCQLRDPWLIAADRALLGCDPTVYLQRFVTPWLSDVMYVSYCTYFVFPLVVALYLWRFSLAALPRFIFIVTFAFYVSYAGYVLFPALGPRYALQHTIRLDQSLVSRAISATLNRLETNIFDVFPSGHVLVCLVCLVGAWRDARRLVPFLLPVGVLLVASTIYCRQHYVVDVLVSVVLLAPVMWIGRRWFDRRPAARAGKASAN
jgi:membrane-associated phospholipid phosphatase